MHGFTAGPAPDARLALSSMPVGLSRRSSDTSGPNSARHYSGDITAYLGIDVPLHGPHVPVAGRRASAPPAAAHTGLPGASTVVAAAALTPAIPQVPFQELGAATAAAADVAAAARSWAHAAEPGAAAELAAAELAYDSSLPHSPLSALTLSSASEFSLTGQPGHAGTAPMPPPGTSALSQVPPYGPVVTVTVTPPQAAPGPAVPLPPMAPFDPDNMPAYLGAAGLGASPGASLTASGLGASSGAGYGRMSAAVVQTTTSSATRSMGGSRSQAGVSHMSAHAEQPGSPGEVQSRVIRDEGTGSTTRAAHVARGPAARHSSSSSFSSSSSSQLGGTKPGRSSSRSSSSSGGVGDGGATRRSSAAQAAGSAAGVAGAAAGAGTHAGPPADHMREILLTRVQPPAEPSSPGAVSDLDGLLNRLRRDLDLTETEADDDDQSLLGTTVGSTGTAQGARVQLGLGGAADRMSMGGGSSIAGAAGAARTHTGRYAAEDPNSSSGDAHGAVTSVTAAAAGRSSWVQQSVADSEGQPVDGRPSAGGGTAGAGAGVGAGESQPGQARPTGRRTWAPVSSVGHGLGSIGTSGGSTSAVSGVRASTSTAQAQQQQQYSIGQYSSVSEWGASTLRSSTEAGLGAGFSLGSSMDTDGSMSCR